MSRRKFPIYNIGVSFCVTAISKVSVMFSVFVETSRASFLLCHLIVCCFVKFATFAAFARVLAGELFGAADKIPAIFATFSWQQIFSNAFNSGHRCFCLPEKKS